MPNHVKTILTISDLGGTQYEAARAAMLDDEGVINFNSICPMPDCLEGFEPNMGVVNRAKLALGLIEPPSEDPRDILQNFAFSNAMKDATTPLGIDHIEAVCLAIENIGVCGHAYWYDWSNENWGTKWNAYGQPEDGHPNDATDFEFQTAWSHPKELMRQLSVKLPDVKFQIKYADEDTGCNCGSYSLKNGAFLDEDIAPSHGIQSPAEKARYTEFAFRLWNGDANPADHGYGSDWEYSDEIYEANNP